MVAVLMFIAASVRLELPHHPDLPDWDVYAELILLALVSVGALISWRWEGAGAALLIAGALGTGSLAALGLGPVRACAITLLFLIPGVMFWLLWQRNRPVRQIATFAVGFAVTMLLAGYVVVDAYSTYFGPLQPVSTTEVAPAGTVEWIWSGGVTDTSAVITTALTEGSLNPQLIVSTRDDFTDPLLFLPDVPATGINMDIRTYSVTGLSPDTAYWYAIRSGDVTDEARQGRFRTFPSGAASFTFAFGACAHTGSNAVVFDTIRETDSLFFMSTGDLFYEDIDVNNPGLYREAFDMTLESPAQSSLYRSAPFVYMWDDHDFGPNDSDGTSPGREAAQSNYRTVVPHYPLPGGTTGGPIYQAFTVGRVRFIMTDNYSSRSPDSMPDGPDKTMLGDEQKAWLKEELRAANGTYPMIVWVNTQPWISGDEDGWGAYATERKEIASFIADNDIQGLSMLSGDAHMLAIDDGSNTNYAVEGDASFPVFHAAALDRPGATKGGPYSEGFYPGPGHFGLVSIRDDGGASIEVIWSGRNHEGEEVVGYRFTVDAGPSIARHSGPLAAALPESLRRFSSPRGPDYDGANQSRNQAYAPSPIRMPSIATKRARKSSGPFDLPRSSFGTAQTRRSQSGRKGRMPACVHASDTMCDRNPRANAIVHGRIASSGTVRSIPPGENGVLARICSSRYSPAVIAMPKGRPWDAPR
jgi:phosphodiesterase/alkaline phosphatase D-like protein